MATEEWIQESLARLESLEEERKKHEDALETASDPATLRMHTQAVERLEVKIRALYAELEAVAAQDGGDDAEEADAGDDLDDAAPEPEPVRAAPARPAAPAAAPFSSPPAAAPFSAAPVSPFGEVPPAAPFSSPPADAPAFASSPAFASTPAASFDSGDDVEAAARAARSASSSASSSCSAAPVPTSPWAANLPKRRPAGRAHRAQGDQERRGPARHAGPPHRQGRRDRRDPRRPHQRDRSPPRRWQWRRQQQHPPSSTEPKKKKDDKATKIESTDDPLAGIR
ncbi:hypothetical protein [Nannocystis pusilla]|uniref:hypothetical protein n=1 Tax=Nannocystis pusilla TaxID=889268 RepID=UPI003B7F9533